MKKAGYPAGTTRLRAFYYQIRLSHRNFRAASLNGVTRFSSRDSHSEGVTSKLHICYGIFQVPELTRIIDHINGRLEVIVGASTPSRSLARLALSSNGATTCSSFEVCRQYVNPYRVDVQAHTVVAFFGPEAIILPTAADVVLVHLDTDLRSSVFP